MKNLIILIFVFVFGNMFSQYRFVYRIDFKIDSLNRDFVQSEIFNLDIKDDVSLFYPEAYLKWDSIYHNKGSINESNLPDPKLHYMIKKDYKEGQTYFSNLVGASVYEVPEPQKIVWKPTNETKEYHNYKVKKATTNFGGREWEAWFSEEFSINDGPYKFNGLPGMILSIKDSRSDYEIYLVEVKKIDRVMTFDFFKMLNFKTLRVDYNTYLKKEKAFIENPALIYIEMGVQLSAEVIKEFSETWKRKQAKRNNNIELTNFNKTTK